MNRDDIKRYLDFYNGNKEGIFSHFTARRISSDVPRDERFSITDFYFQNDIRVIQDTRINFTPSRFDVTVTRSDTGVIHTGLTGEVNRWLRSRNFGGGRSFWEALPGYLRTHENYGTLFLKLFVRGGRISVQKMETRDVEAVADERNYLDVKKYIFSWEETHDLEGGGTRQVSMREEIDGAGYRRYADGKLISEDAHDFGFIPVVKIIREEVEGSPYGNSGIAGLIEAQQNVNMALTKRAWATKYNSFRVWAPKEAGFVEQGTAIRVSPGSLSPIPIEAVGGDVDLTAVEREVDDALDHLYRLGSVPRRLKDDMVRAATSAKALNAMLEGLKRYTETKLVYLGRGFEELMEKYLLIRYGTDAFEVTVEFPSLDREDPDYVLNRARFLAESGRLPAALSELGYETEAKRERSEENEGV